MQLQNEFMVPVPVEQAWQMMLDVERIAPCMPGATVDRVDGDEVAGRVKVKVGPVALSYSGSARFKEKDETAHRLVLEASGRETRGSGTASAVIETRMSERDSGTQVSVVTDLDVTGKPAQFGRGVMADVAGKLTGQFAACLAARAQGAATGNGQAGAAAGTSTTAAPPTADQVQAAPSQPQQPEALDLVGTVGLPLLKRFAPVLAGLVAGLVIGSVLGGLRRRRSPCSIIIDPTPGQELRARIVV
jgi:uncharacterized protein